MSCARKVLLQVCFCSAVAWSQAVYHFDEGSGTTAVDASGAGHNGTIQGATYTTGHAGTALHFTGTDTGRVLVPPTTFTGFGNTAYVEAWIRPSKYGGYVFRKDAEYNDFWAWLRPSGNLQCLVYESGKSGSYAVAEGGTITLNTWTNIACWYDGTTMHALINGVEVASQNHPIASINWQLGYDRTEIGNSTHYPGNGYGFTGDIDDVIISTAKGVTTSCTPPSITSQPQSQTITAGQTATLTVTATGTAPLSYQWYQG